MLITTSQLRKIHEISYIDILNNSVFLSETEAVTNPISIPILENNRLGVNIVYYKDILKMNEDYNYSTINSLNAITESSNVDIDTVAIAIDESDIILNPRCIESFDRYVIIPESDYSVSSIFVEACIDGYLENELDEDYIYLMCNPEIFLEKGGIPNFVPNNYKYENGKIIDVRTGKEAEGLSNKQINSVKNNKKHSNDNSNNSGSNSEESGFGGDFLSNMSEEDRKRYEGKQQIDKLTSELKELQKEKESSSVIDEKGNKTSTINTRKASELEEKIQKIKQKIEQIQGNNAGGTNNNNNNNNAGGTNNNNNNNNAGGTNNKQCRWYQQIKSSKSIIYDSSIKNDFK